MTDPIERLRVDLARLTDQRDRLQRVADARFDVEQISFRYVIARREAIIGARRTYPRLKWREIGEIFNVSAQRAEAMSKQDPNPSTTERTQP